MARVEAILLEDWQKKTEAERTEWAMQKAWKAQNVQNAQDLQKARAKMQKERVDLGGSWTDTWTGHLRHAYSSMHVRMSSRRVAPPVHNAAVAPLAAPSEAIGGEGGRGGVLAECQHVYVACMCPITAEVMTDPVSTLDGFTYERAAITEWLRTNDTSPFTGAKLESKMLIPNLTVRCLLQHV